MNILRFEKIAKRLEIYFCSGVWTYPCNTWVRRVLMCSFKENSHKLHHTIFIFMGCFYFFWQTGSKMVSCSLQFDESSDDDLEKLMTPSSKRKLDLSHVSHMSHMSIASPMQEYVSPCFQVRQQQIMSLFYVPWLISLNLG